LARATIKEFAAKEYIYVCSVGNWNTYKPKSALQDVARATGQDLKEVMGLTTSLPDDFDEMTLEDHAKLKANLENPDQNIREEAQRDISKYKYFYEFQKSHPDLVDLAFRLVGKIRAQGTHAGGVIIADRPIDKIIPLSLLGGTWTSQWTEGKKTQLSKFGLVKFDILGLKTIYYIWQAGNLIKRSLGIDIDWSMMDPTTDPPYVGHETLKDGRTRPILLNDILALKMANDLKTDSVFQIETPIQKGLIKSGGIRSFWDLVAFNAMGRPGPIEQCAEYIRRRDDEKQSWKISEDPRIVKILESTFGILCYQEQLTSLWTTLAGFTIPEAEAARKVIAKKWTEKLSEIEIKWKKGAVKTLGKEKTDQLWALQVSFGQYAFNYSHALSYSIITYRCLWLKAHYPAQWWAAVLSECHPDKLPIYMSAAKLDRVKFSHLDVNNLTNEFAIGIDGSVTPGLLAIKGIGEKSTGMFAGAKGPFKDIDDFINKVGKDRRLFERLIKLGAFDSLHPNRQALWIYYQYYYCNDPDIKKLILSRLGWSEEKILAQRQKEIEKFTQCHPKRKIPPKVQNWQVNLKKELAKNSKSELEQITELFRGYSVLDMLTIEKELLGYFWTSPLDIYQHRGYNIEKAKVVGILEVVVQKIIKRISKAQREFYVLKVTDGIQNADVMIWPELFESVDRKIFSEGVGIKLMVEYNEERRSFKIQNNTNIIALRRRDETAKSSEKESKVEELIEDPVW
jgi:DNA polymerase III alpha subunit